MIRDFIDWLVFAITVIAGLAGIVMVIYKVTGHSPTIEEVLLVLVVLISGLLINHMRDTGKFEGHARAELAALRRDMEQVKSDLRRLTAKHHL